jgi:hypothetical protein
MTGADLSHADVDELRRFLFATCDEITQWLPPPQWIPTWNSEAARECANTERGPADPWGADPVLTVYAGGALYLDTILDCLRNLAVTLTPDTTHYVVEALARAAMEAGAVLYWLLKPGIGARWRVARFWLMRNSGAGYLDKAVKKVDPRVVPGVYGETPAMVVAAVNGLGLTVAKKVNPKTKRKVLTYEGEMFPGYTNRAEEFERAVYMTAAYAIYSAPAHAEWHAVVGRFREEIMPDGQRLMILRPDREAVSGAVLAAAGFAIKPAEMALKLLGRTARVHEICFHAVRANDLIHRLGLPEAWSGWRP